MSSSEPSSASAGVPAFTHFVFVDFENVPSVNLGLVSGKRAHVTLLIGKNQTKVDVDMAEQIQRHPSQVRLIKVGASGRNALDLTLAFHLGQAAQRIPNAHYIIVSKDKDFVPLVAHLTALGIKVTRQDTFSIPGTPAAKKKTAATPAPPPPPRSHSPVASRPDRATKVVAQLKNHASRNRPSTLTRLRSKIKTDLGPDFTEAKSVSIIDRLRDDGTLAINEKGKVTYGPAAALNPS